MKCHSVLWGLLCWNEKNCLCWRRKRNAAFIRPSMLRSTHPQQLLCDTKYFRSSLTYISLDGYNSSTHFYSFLVYGWTGHLRNLAFLMVEHWFLDVDMSTDGKHFIFVFLNIELFFFRVVLRSNLNIKRSKNIQFCHCQFSWIISHCWCIRPWLSCVLTH